LNSELSTAVNIKDKTNRKNVITAIKSVIEKLKTIRQTPDTGLGIYTGYCF